MRLSLLTSGWIKIMRNITRNKSAGLHTRYEDYSNEYDLGARAIMGGLKPSDLKFNVVRNGEYLGQPGTNGYAPEQQAGNGKHRIQPDMPYPKQQQRDDLEYVPRKGTRPTPF